MDKLRLVNKSVLELTECWRVLWCLFLTFGHRVSRRGGTSPSRSRWFPSNLLGLVRFDALQVNLLHSLQFHVGLGVAACASAELAESVVLIQVEFRSLQVFVNIFG